MFRKGQTFSHTRAVSRRVVLKGKTTIARSTAIIPLVALIALALNLNAAAHDIPNDVTVQAFLKPEGQRLHLLVRVPMRACRDVDFPTRGPGYLDLARADASLNKQIRVTEKKYFQLRLSAFNVTHTAIFSSPSSMVITNAFFGQIRNSTGERNVNIVAKLYF